MAAEAKRQPGLLRRWLQKVRASWRRAGGMSDRSNAGRQAREQEEPDGGPVPIVSRAKAVTTTYSATKYFGAVGSGTPAHETTPMRTRRARPQGTGTHGRRKDQHWSAMGLIISGLKFLS